MATLRQERTSSFLQHTLSETIEHPVQSLIIVLFAIGIITRVLSGLQFRAVASNQPQGNSPRTVPILPYWVPWLGHAINFAVGGTDFLTSAARSLSSNGSIYARKFPVSGC